MVLTRKQHTAAERRDENNEICDTKNEIKIMVDQSERINDSKISEKMKDENPSSAETDNVSDYIPHGIIHDPGSSLIQHNRLDGNIIKMLFIQYDGEQKLFTFDSPTDDCTVKDLIDEAKIPIDESLGIFIVKEPKKIGINYIVESMLKTDIISEENNNNNKQSCDVDEYDIHKSGKNASSGFFSSTEGNSHGNSVTSIKNDMIVEDEINEIDNYELVESESEEDKSVPIDIKRKRKRKRPIAKRKIYNDDPKCSFHISLDEEDREKGNSKEPGIGNNKTKKLLGLDNKQKNLMKRSKESKSMIENTENVESQCLLVYPPSPAKGGIAISAQDFACLKEGEFLNDIIIDFYLKYLSLEVLLKEDQDRTYIFSIHFYKKLTTLKPSAKDKDSQSSQALNRFSNVKKWTKHVNIFKKDFIIVPINQHAHWFLAIICFPALVGKSQINSTGAEIKSCDVKEMKYKLRKPRAMKPAAKSPCILLFDSLAGSESRAQSVIQILREYLSFEYAAKVGKRMIFSKETIEGACPKVPQQNNFSDCGLYVLQYVESFFNDPITDYTRPINTLENWFDEICIIRKRKEISELLNKLKQR